MVLVETIILVLEIILVTKSNVLELIINNEITSSLDITWGVP